MDETRKDDRAMCGGVEVAFLYTDLAVARKKKKERNADAEKCA